MIRSEKDSKLYIGFTNDLRRRLKEHNDKKNFSTRSRVPFDLVYYEAYQSEEDARRREQNLKLRANALSQLKRRIKNSLEAR